jgi:hypothetical protein
MTKKAEFVPEITDADRQLLRQCVLALEYPSFTARMADVVGAPIEGLIKRLPDGASRAIGSASDTALRRTLDLALITLRDGQVPASPGIHKVAVATSGAIGGAAGLGGLAIELPITTTLLFRSIADIARAEGEDLRDPDTCLACLQVFALGSPKTDDDDGVDSGYFAARVALAQAVKEASVYLARGVVVDDAAPLLVRLIVAIGARFNIIVSSKAAAQLVPIIGALGGAVINTLFMDHFQTVAHGHFSVRRLEKLYGPDYVRQIYDEEFEKLRKLTGTELATEFDK